MGICHSSKRELEVEPSISERAPRRGELSSSDSVKQQDIVWVNDAWTCKPNTRATAVSDNGNLLKIYDKNNPEVTDWCCPGDWRVDGRYAFRIHDNAASFQVTASVDFSNAVGKDGAINCNLYLCNRKTKSWTYGDASYRDYWGNRYCELDLFETGNHLDDHGIPTLMQISSHNDAGKQCYCWVGFGGYKPPLDKTKHPQLVDTMATSAVATKAMTLTYTMSKEENMKLRIHQGDLVEEFDLGFVVMDIEKYYLASVHCGVLNCWHPHPEGTDKTKEQAKAEAWNASSLPKTQASNASSLPRGYWVLANLTVTNAKMSTDNVMWSGRAEGERPSDLWRIQLVGGETE